MTLYSLLIYSVIVGGRSFHAHGQEIYSKPAVLSLSLDIGRKSVANDICNDQTYKFDHINPIFQAMSAASESLMMLTNVFGTARAIVSAIVIARCKCSGSSASATLWRRGKLDVFCPSFAPHCRAQVLTYATRWNKTGQVVSPFRQLDDGRFASVFKLTGRWADGFRCCPQFLLQRIPWRRQSRRSRAEKLSTDSPSARSSIFDWSLRCEHSGCLARERTVVACSNKSSDTWRPFQLLLRHWSTAARSRRTKRSSSKWMISFTRSTCWAVFWLQMGIVFVPVSFPLLPRSGRLAACVAEHVGGRSCGMWGSKHANGIRYSLAFQHSWQDLHAACEAVTMQSAWRLSEVRAAKTHAVLLV